MRPRQYSESDSHFLQEVASQVAPAVVNLKGFQQIKELNQRAAQIAERRRALLEVNNAVITSLRQEELTAKVGGALRRLARSIV